MTNSTQVERRSEFELVATRMFDGPARLVFEAWTNPVLFQRWWVAKSCPVSLRSCEMDVRPGGLYRLEFDSGGQSAVVFGTYVEVMPHARLVWTNDEGAEDAVAVTTVIFEERDGTTLLTMVDRHPSKEALDEAIASGSTSGTPESWDQLAALLASARS